GGTGQVVGRGPAEPFLSDGAAWADSCADVARANEIVFASVSGAPALDAVAVGQRGVVRGAAPGSLFVNLSTVHPHVIRRLAGELAEARIHTLDAPRSGGSHPGAPRR